MSPLSVGVATLRVTTTWSIPRGGSPDMGNVSIDGKLLWLSGRPDDVVYGKEPHGLTVWPQPGRYSLGHNGQHAFERG